MFNGDKYVLASSLCIVYKINNLQEWVGFFSLDDVRCETSNIHQNKNAKKKVQRYLYFCMWAVVKKNQPMFVEN